MKNILFVSVFLLNAVCSLSVQALDLSQFTQSEYAFNLREPESRNMAPTSLTGKRAKLLDFVNFESVPHESWVTYLDTPDQDLGNNSLIIRVREEPSRPHLSRITVKLRAPSPEGFGDIKKYRKAEINIVNGNKSYSVSWDVTYQPNDLDMRKVDLPYVLDHIQNKNPEAWSAIEPLMDTYASQLQQTMVMRTLRWEGLVTNVPGIVEAEYQIWSPYYRTPKIFFSSVAFKGDSSDRNLEVVAKRIDDALIKNGIAVPPEEARSETAGTFAISPGFNP